MGNTVKFADMPLIISVSMLPMHSYHMPAQPCDMYDGPRQALDALAKYAGRSIGPLVKEYQAASCDISSLLDGNVLGHTLTAMTGYLKRPNERTRLPREQAYLLYMPGEVERNRLQPYARVHQDGIENGLGRIASMSLWNLSVGYCKLRGHTNCAQLSLDSSRPKGGQIKSRLQISSNTDIMTVL